MKFDATGIDTTNNYEALPAGEYLVMITDSQEKPTKNGDGRYLELTLELQGDQMRGRKVWDRLNLKNQNQKAVEIAQRQLAQICHAVNVLQVNEWSQLHFKPLVAIVKVRSDDRGMSNEVKAYKAAAAATSNSPAATQPRVSSAPAAPRAAPQMPWATTAA